MKIRLYALAVGASRYRAARPLRVAERWPVDLVVATTTDVLSIESLGLLRQSG
jgi:hypothetical protein